MNKKNIILPISYFPPVTYFFYIYNYDNIFIEINEHYQKQTIRNHTIISGANGDQKLIVPIKRKSYSKTVISEVKIQNKLWIKKHIQAIQTNYGNSPFFIHYFDDIKQIILNSGNNLFYLNQKILDYILKQLNLNKKINYTKIFNRTLKEDFHDMRNFEKKKIVKLNYTQTFCNQKININISILDLLFNLGNDSKNFISKLNFEKT